MMTYDLENTRERSIHRLATKNGRRLGLLDAAARASRLAASCDSRFPSGAALLRELEESLRYAAAPARRPR